MSIECVGGCGLKNGRGLCVKPIEKVLDVGVDRGGLSEQG